jgi:hypothetical protein
VSGCVLVTPFRDNSSARANLSSGVAVSRLGSEPDGAGVDGVAGRFRELQKPLPGGVDTYRPPTLTPRPISRKAALVQGLLIRPPR